MKVQEAGMGMEFSCQNKILDKGFSTKGNNRGFGLYLLAQAIERLEGELIISSKPGKGTSFAAYVLFKRRMKKID
ncbi:ATP-binding protein [Bacillales bacterium AN1005]